MSCYGHDRLPPVFGDGAVTLVRGSGSGQRPAASGDVGSAVAHALFSNGYRVLIHDQPAPRQARPPVAAT